MYKQFFDVFVLLLVGYSCITTIFAVAFLKEDEKPLSLFIIDWVVEGVFYIDIVLNFLQARKTDMNVVTRDLKGIAKIYMTSWFFIDFISVFPFQLIITTHGVATKLLRLFRIPRMIKLLDKQRIKNIIIGRKERNNKIVSTQQIVNDF